MSWNPCNPCNPCTPCGPTVVSFNPPWILEPQVIIDPIQFNSQAVCRQNSVCKQKHVRILTSRFPGVGSFSDDNLSRPWGATVSKGFYWVANHDTGVVSPYNLAGSSIPSILTLPIVEPNTENRPTAVISNTSSGFIITEGFRTGPAAIIIVTSNGFIAASLLFVLPDTGTIPPNVATITVNNSETAVYTGAAMANATLYVTNFKENSIETYASNFTRIAPSSYPFVDPNPQIGFAPFAIHYIGGQLYVTYAQFDSESTTPAIPIIGSGYINVFTLSGTFVRRFATGGQLNAPWGMLLAPKYMCYPEGSVLVSNYGDGLINVYNTDGVFIENLKKTNTDPIMFEGLLSITQHNNNIFLTSGGEGASGALGLFSTIVRDLF